MLIFSIQPTKYIKLKVVSLLAGKFRICWPDVAEYTDVGKADV